MIPLTILLQSIAFLVVEAACLFLCLWNVRKASSMPFLVISIGLSIVSTAAWTILHYLDYANQATAVLGPHMISVMQAASELSTYGSFLSQLFLIGGCIYLLRERQLIAEQFKQINTMVG
jgi:hypothetical protein